MDFNKEPIYEIIEAFEKYGDNIRIGKERSRIKRKVENLKRDMEQPRINLRVMENAYDVMQTLKALAKVKFEKYPGMPEFYKAMTGAELEDAKDDLRFCELFREGHKVDRNSSALLGSAYRSYSTMGSKYKIHMIRKQWENGDYEPK